MAGLRLAKLPDRTLVKLAITVSPELKLALDRYAALYEEAYGIKEPIAELIPAMLTAFLESDRTFVRGRKASK